MVRDEYKRKKRADGGYKALEHPNVPKQRREKDTISPSFDCSSSTSPSTTSILKEKQIVSNKISKVEFTKDLPVWLDEEVWDAFVEHRKTVRAPMSDMAKIRAINKLKKLKDEGEDITELLNNSIINGWKGLFPDRNSRLRNTSFSSSKTSEKKPSATEQTIMRALTHVSS